MGADPSALAMAALTAVAGALHAETKLRVGDGWWETPILWAALIGPPSTMKSPVIDKATKPLRDIDHERDKHWRYDYGAWRHLTDKNKPAENAIPPPVKPARCTINDATPEKVAELLSRSSSGSLMVHDELAGWFGGFERYSSGAASRAFYLQCWNGGTFLKDRVGKGRSDLDAEIRIDNLALCILGGIQPDRLAELGDLTSDGLLQRLLPVLMKPAERGDEYYPVAGAEADYEALIRSVNVAPAQNYYFADDALEIRDRVLDHLYVLENVDGFASALVGAIGKLKGYFARLCLVLHVARQHDPRGFVVPDWVPAWARTSEPDAAFAHLNPQADNLSDGIIVRTEISRQTAEAAEKVVREFVLPHNLGLYDVVVNGGEDRDMLRSIANFILASDKGRLLPSDLTAGVRALRGEREQKIKEWAGRFCAMGWLEPEELKQPGLPSKAWIVDPELREYFSERRKRAKAARAEAHAIMKTGGSRRQS
jgi:hypothetical protein